MTTRWDETWHRLREWTNGQGPSERLAAQILLDAGYESLDPSHPLGGKDGAKDAVCLKEGQRWIMAVSFPRGQQQFAANKSKFVSDLAGVTKNGASGIAFVTNQELSLAERKELCQVAGTTQVDLFHLERLTTVLDQPKMAGVRRQFLGIDHLDSQLSAGWANVLPDELKPLISLELTTPPPITRNIARSADGQFWLVYWNSAQCQYRWEKVTEEYAADVLQPVARYRNMNDWRNLL
jgi:hypothetical protein